ncbi:MAG: SH3 domain-containing protein, partial [Anaerolineae bacterium]|nr:SH3 domain-containing protein [Anaerolineae bacterium]
MKSTGIFRIALILTILLSITIFIAPSSAQVGVVAAVEIDLTLRVGPGTEWRQLGILPAGTNVRLDGRDNSGAWARGITQNGEIGWMAARYLSVGDDSIFALPVIDREAPISVEAPPPGTVPVTAPSQPAQQQAAAPAAAAPIQGGVVATALANVNMRGGPSTEYNRVGGLSYGEQFNIDGRDPFVNWVRGVNGAGVVGWVSANFISLDYNAIAALPIVEVGSPFGLAVPQGAAPAEESAAPVAPIPPPVVSTSPVTGFSY